MQNKVLPTVWIELTVNESISRPMQTLSLTPDKNVTIKQCVRNLSVCSPSETTPSKKNIFNFPYSVYQQPAEVRRFDVKRSISLISNRMLLTKNPPKSRPPSIQSAKSSQLRQSVDSCTSAGTSCMFSGSSEASSEGKSQEKTPTIARGQSVGSGSVASDSLIKIRPWSTCSEPAQLIDMENLHGNGSPV